MLYRPTRTVAKFISSQAFVCMIMAPRSEGKTTGGLFRPIYIAQNLPDAVLPIRGIVVRDTWTNLQRTTMDNIREWEKKGLQVEWQQRDTEAILGGNLVHLFFVGMDRPSEVNKLQGFGAGFLWIEEPAPAADISGGIAPEVFGVGVTSLRQESVPHWVQITMNPPDEDHWTLKVAEVLEQSFAESNRLNLTVAIFNIPPGERVSEEEREINRLALESIGRGDLVSRLVEGKAGMVVKGERVVPEFNETTHVASKWLPINKKVPVIRKWDFGLHPCCVFSQVTPLGHWYLFDGLVGENIGLVQLIENQVIPWQLNHLYDPSLYSFRDIMDPSGTEREQANSELSAVRTLTEMLNASPEPGPVSWSDRRDAIKAAFNRKISGRELVQIDPRAKLLIRTLKGGAAYPKDALGRITETVEAMKKNSGIFSHPLDCMCYGAAVLFSLPDTLRPVKKRIPVRPRQRQALGWLGA